MAEEKVQFQATPVPKFDGDYDHWSMVMKTLIQSKECWNVVTDGYTEIRSGEQATPTQRKNYEENKLKDLKVLNYLFQSIDKSILKTITMKETSKQVWDAMKIKYQGSARVKRAQLQRLRRSFEVLEMKTGECVIDYLGRVMVIANEMRACGDDMTDVKIVEKVLRTLTENFNYIVCTIEETKNLDELSVDELQSSLLCHEQKLLKKSAEEQVLKVEQETSYGRGRGRGRSSSRGRGRGRGRGGFDKSVVECYRCHKLGHFQYECPTEEKAVNYAEFDENEELLLMATVDIERYQREEEVLMAESETLREGKERIWFLDSACSNHMTGNKLWFTKLDMSFTHSVKLGNDKKMEIKGIGDVKIRVNGVTQIITKVYYAPDLTSNLISVGQLQDKGVTFIFKNGCCKVYHPIKGLILSSKMTKNRMFPIFVEPNDSESCMQVITGEDLWHRRFAHVSHKALRTMQFNGMVEGLPKVAEKTQVCEVCAIGKQNRVEIPKKSKWHASEKLQLVHTDICGPITPKSMSSKRYVLVFIDDFSRKTWVYCLATKGEAFEYFKKFKALVENETGHYVKCLRSDRGGEFTSQEFNIFCEKEGIQRQLTAAYTPQQNGVAERRNRTLINMVRCLLAEKEMPKHFWAEAVVWACHVLNRCISRSLDKMVPEEIWTGVKPSVGHFRVFGSVGYAHVPVQLRTKLDDKSHKCIFLGVSIESKAYRLYDPITKKLVISRDVIFDEGGKWDWNLSKEEKQELVIEEEDSRGNQEVPVVNSPLTEDNPEVETTTTAVQNEAVPQDINEGTVEESDAEIQTGGSHTPSRSTGPTTARTRKTPAWMKDYYTSCADEESLAMYSALEDPASYEEAAKEDKWVAAMKTEIEAIERNHTWELVDPEPGVKPIGVKWIFKTKLNEKGEVEKYKARLVVKGYAQKQGVDYTEVFAPVARWDTIRMFLAIAAKRRWTVYQLDVKSAFLHGELKETVYVEQPEGFIKREDEGKVYKLKKALYGLKQAPRAWYHRIEAYFKGEGFKKSGHDHTLFVKKVWGKILIVSLYVDDLIYAGSDKMICDTFKESMKREFDMTDLGKMKYFLGVEISQTEEAIEVSQEKYAKEVVKRFGMEEANPVHVPMVPGAVLTKLGSGEEVDETLYKSLVGSLMYLTVSRPDIMYVVSLISRFMAKPREDHFLAAKRVLRYIRGTYKFGLRYVKGKKDDLVVFADSSYARDFKGKMDDLVVFTDSNYARDGEDRRSTSGYVCLLSGAAVCWCSRKQEIVTLSSTEAEYVAAGLCACHCVWMKGLLEEMEENTGTVTIFCDNTSTIKLSKNPVMHRRTKHIDVRYHYLRELVEKQVVELEFCGTKQQLADGMTKPVKEVTFNEIRTAMGVCEVKQDA
ncbi:putative RNA-directed DNA polymerase [Helianthus annuus]|nr:putative RNA-directed DNA polymerase [Helianthus annuus]KAJ0911074.1 putative RNA-directed DNA polymerase [Helianthus annuus]